MLFRVIFSNDVDKYYENQMDINLSMTIEATSFNNACIIARTELAGLVFWDEDFEIVSIQRVDIEPHIESTYGETCKTLGLIDNEDLRYVVDPKKTPDDWCTITGIELVDADGWNRKEFEKSWGTRITRDEFLARARKSTCKAWPTILRDEW